MIFSLGATHRRSTLSCPSCLWRAVRCRTDSDSFANSVSDLLSANNRSCEWRRPHILVMQVAEHRFGEDRKRGVGRIADQSAVSARSRHRSALTRQEAVTLVRSHVATSLHVPGEL